jgi:hypothetical protein
MTSHVFTSADSATFPTGIFYIFPVEQTPSLAATSVQDCLKPAGFPPVILQNKVLTATAMTFDEPLLPNFTYPNPTVGLVIARRVGASVALSDPLVAFSTHRSIVGNLDTTLPAGLASIKVRWPSPAGAIALQPTWTYESGPFSFLGNAVFGNDTINLLGTLGGTQTFANPRTFNAPGQSVPFFQSGSLVSQTGSTFINPLLSTDRSTASTMSARKYEVWDGGDLVRWRVDEIYGYGSLGTAYTFNIWGSNDTSIDYTAGTTDFVSPAKWTLLGTASNLNVGAAFYGGSVDPNYYRYIKFEGNPNPTSTVPAELQLYGAVRLPFAL